MDDHLVSFVSKAFFIAQPSHFSFFEKYLLFTNQTRYAKDATMKTITKNSCI